MSTRIKYSCLPDEDYQLGKYVATTIRKQDIFKIKEWRNSQLDVLRQVVPLTDEDQLRYYNETIVPSFLQPRPRIILFSYLFGDELIGYGGLTNCSWLDRRSELSFLLSPERQQNHLYEEDFSFFIRLMKRINFEVLRFNRLFTETYDIRPLHISILEKNGFVKEGTMRKHVHINGRFEDSLIHGCLSSEYKHGEIG